MTCRAPTLMACALAAFVLVSSVVHVAAVSNFYNMQSQTVSMPWFGPNSPSPRLIGTDTYLALSMPGKQVDDLNAQGAGAVRILRYKGMVGFAHNNWIPLASPFGSLRGFGAHMSASGEFLGISDYDPVASAATVHLYLLSSETWDLYFVDCLASVPAHLRLPVEKNVFTVDSNDGSLYFVSLVSNSSQSTVVLNRFVGGGIASSPSLTHGCDDPTYSITSYNNGMLHLVVGGNVASTGCGCTYAYLWDGSNLGPLGSPSCTTSDPRATAVVHGVRFGDSWNPAFYVAVGSASTTRSLKLHYVHDMGNHILPGQDVYTIGAGLSAPPSSTNFRSVQVAMDNNYLPHVFTTSQDSSVPSGQLLQIWSLQSGSLVNTFSVDGFMQSCSHMPATENGYSHVYGSDVAVVLATNIFAAVGCVPRNAIGPHLIEVQIWTRASA